MLLVFLLSVMSFCVHSVSSEKHSIIPSYSNCIAFAEALKWKSILPNFPGNLWTTNQQSWVCCFGSWYLRQGCTLFYSSLISSEALEGKIRKWSTTKKVSIQGRLIKLFVIMIRSLWYLMKSVVTLFQYVCHVWSVFYFLTILFINFMILWTLDHVWSLESMKGCQNMFANSSSFTALLLMPVWKLDFIHYCETLSQFIQWLLKDMAPQLNTISTNY